MKFSSFLMYCFSLLLFFPACNEIKKVKTKSEMVSLTSPSEKGSGLPFLFADSEKLLMSWVTETDTLATLYYSEFNNNRWSSPEIITSGTDWFVNWADYPQIAKNGENYTAHILKKSDSATYAYDVYVTQKQGEGTWSAPFKIHSDTTKTEHGFVSYIPFGESQFLVSWLDGRNTSSGHHDHHGLGGAMTLRAAIVNPDGSLEDEFLLDESVCDCCQTSSTMTTNGPVVVYRDRSEKEVRDISIVRYENQKWTAPKTIHKDDWEIAGCPVNGPRVDALENTLAVAWFTAAGGESKVKLAFSKNGEEEFNTPVRIDSGNPLGRVDVVMIDENNALASWVEDHESETFIKFRKVSVGGDIGEVKTLTTTDAARASGFPQIAVYNGNMYFAWTDMNETISQIKTAVFPIEDL